MQVFSSCGVKILMTLKEPKIINESESAVPASDNFAPNFDDLVRRHQAMVINLCARFLNNRQDAIDAAQDIFIKVYYALDEFKPEAQFSTWLYRISVNHCLNLLRSRKRKILFSLFTGQQGAYRNDLLLVEDQANNPEKELLDKEKFTAVNRAVAALPDNYRTVIILHRFQGLAYQQIADVLGVSVATVESRLHRAKKKLACSLSKYLNDQVQESNRKCV